MNNQRRNSIRNMIIAALCLALTQVLPFFTGQIPQIGNMLTPMHIPVLICGFLCLPRYAVIIGFIAPLLRFLLFGMPPIFPIGIAMSFELATYGLISALLYRRLKQRKFGLLISLLVAMTGGRLVWGLVMTIIAAISDINFGFQAFLTMAFITAIPGIIVQIVLIPAVVFAVNRAGYGQDSTLSETDVEN